MRLTFNSSEWTEAYHLHNSVLAQPVGTLLCSLLNSLDVGKRTPATSTIIREHIDPSMTENELCSEESTIEKYYWFALLCSESGNYCTLQHVKCIQDMFPSYMPNSISYSAIGSRFGRWPSEQLTQQKMKEYIDAYMALGPQECIDYDVLTPSNLFGVSLYYLFEHGKVIKRCNNCGKFFVPENRSDTIYCSEMSPQDSKKTCKEYGKAKTYLENLRTNEAAGLYRRIYMRKQMLVKRNPDIYEYQQAFERYKVESKRWRSDVKSGMKTEKEYISWLKMVKEKRVS